MRNAEQFSQAGRCTGRSLPPPADFLDGLTVTVYRHVAQHLVYSGIVRGLREMTATDANRQHEIDSTYELLGLGTAAARAQFADWFTQQRPTLQLDITISTTSNPNRP